MKNRPFIFTITIIIALLTFKLDKSFSSSWTINDKKSIQLQNENRDFLRFDIDKRRAVRVWLILVPKESDAFLIRRPIYQIDNNPCHDLVKAYDYKSNTEKDQWIRWIIVKKDQKKNEDLHEFIQGRTVVFQYYLPDGSIEETAFNLINADRHIYNLLLLR
jgi:hypothetical protein